MMDEKHEQYMKYFMNDGFLKPKLTVELPLYRYRSNPDYVVDEIVNDHIFMSPIESLNDPFDSSYGLSFEEALQCTDTVKSFMLRSYFLHSEKWFQEVEKQLLQLCDSVVSLDDFSKMLSEQIKKAGDLYPSSAIASNYYELSMLRIAKRIEYGNVACFSEVWDSIPMWSYYADSHKGVCLKYDFSLLDREDISNQNILSSIQKVWYSQNRPCDRDGVYSPFMKGLQWAHEQEWRLFSKFGSEYVKLPCLSEIYLGVQFDGKNYRRIIEAAKANGRNIKIYLLRPSPDTYSFHKIPIILK